MQKKNMPTSQQKMATGASELESQKSDSEVQSISSSFAATQRPKLIEEGLLQPERKVAKKEYVVAEAKNDFLNNPLFQESNPRAKQNREIYINSLAKKGYDKRALEESAISVEESKALLQKSMETLNGKGFSDPNTGNTIYEQLPNPNDHNASYEAGTALLGLNKPDDAIAMFNKTLSHIGDKEQGSDVPVQNELAMDYGFTKRGGDSPVNSLAGLSVAFSQKGDYATALDYANEALKLDPKNENALKVRAFSKYKTGDKEGAKEDLKEASVVKEANKPFEAMREQLGEEATAQRAQQRQADYMNQIADGLTSFIAGDKDGKFGLLGYLSPLGKYVSGVQEGAKVIGEGLKQMESGVTSGNIGKVGSGALTLAEGGISTAFNAMPPILAFNASIEGTKEAIGLLPESAKKHGLEVVSNLEKAFFSPISELAGALDLSPEEGGDSEKVFHLLDVAGSIALMGGAHKGVSKIGEGTRALKEIQSKISNAKTPSEFEAIKKEIKAVTVDDIKVALEKDDSKQSKALLSDIENAERDKDIAKVQEDRAKRGIESEPIINYTDDVNRTLDRLHDGVPVDNVAVIEAENHLYEEWKRLHELKKDPNRMFTTEQINEGISTLENIADAINEYKAQKHSPELIELHKKQEQLNSAKDLTPEMQAKIEVEKAENAQKIKEQETIDSNNKKSEAMVDVELNDINGKIEAEQKSLEANKGNVEVEATIEKGIAELEAKKEELKKAQKKEPPLKKSFDYSEGKTSSEVIKEMGVDRFNDEGEAERFVAENSKNPLELAETFLRVEGEARSEKQSDIDRRIEESNVKLTEQQFADIASKADIDGFVRKNFITNEVVGDKYDKVLEDAGVTVEQFVEYVKHKQRAKLANKSTPLKSKIKKSSKDLTGQELTPSSAKRIIDLEKRKEKRDIAEAEDKMAAEAVGEKEAFTESVAKGETPAYDSEKFGNKEPGKKLSEREEINRERKLIAIEFERARLAKQLGKNPSRSGIGLTDKDIALSVRFIKNEIKADILTGKELLASLKEMWGIELSDSEIEILKDKINAELDAWEKTAKKDLIAAKNLEIDLNRQKFGLDPVMKDLRRSDEQLFNEVAEIVNDGNRVQNMVDYAIKNDRYTFTDAEQLAILHDRSKIEESLIKLDEKVNSGDVSDATLSARTVERFKLDDYDNVLRNIGTSAARVMRSRQLYADKSLSSRVILQRMSADAKGEKVPKEMVEKVDKLVAERKLIDAEILRIHDELELARMTIAELEALVDYENLAKNDIEIDFRENAPKKERKARVESKVDELRLRQKQRGNIKDARNLPKELLEDEALIKDIGKEIVRDALEEGRKLKPSEWIKGVEEALGGIYPEMTTRQLSEILSGYGKVAKENTDPVAAELRDLNTQMRIILGIEDVKGGSLPKRSGLQRKEMTPEQRILRRELAKAIKDMGLDKIDYNDPAKMKSAIERVKAGLNNQIELLDAEIAKGERIGADKRSPLPFDKAVEDLKAERDAKKAALEIVLEKKGVLAQEKLAQNKKQLQGKIDGLVDAINNEKDIRKKEKKGNLSDAELKQLEATKNGLQDVYDKWYNEKFKEELAVKDLDSKIDRLLKSNEKKLKSIEQAQAKKNYEGVLAKKKNIKDYSTYSDAVKNKQIELEKAKVEQKKVNEKILDLREEWRLVNRNKLAVMYDHFLNLTREGLISAPSAIAKILSSGIAYQFVQLPANIMGPLAEFMLPKVVGEKANIENKFSLGTELRSLGKLVDGKTWKEAWKKFETRKHTEDEKFGQHKFQQEYIIPINIGGKKFNVDLGFFGKTHGFAKTPGYKVAYNRALEYILIDVVKDVNNFDPTTKELKRDVVERVEKEAYTEALTHVFLNPNWIASWIHGGIARLDKSPNVMANVLGALIKAQTQVLSVGLNYAGKQLSYMPGWGHAEAALPLMKKYLNKSMDSLTPEEANFIMKKMKSGNVGIALFAIGYFNPDMFDENGDLVVNGTKLPHWATHIPVLFVMKLGGMAKHAVDEPDEKKSYPLKVVKEMVKTNPFSYSANEFGNAGSSDEKMVQLLFNQTLGKTVPQVVQEFARMQNKDDEGKQIKREVYDRENAWYKNITNMYKMKIPGAIKTIPEK